MRFAYFLRRYILIGLGRCLHINIRETLLKIVKYVWQTSNKMHPIETILLNNLLDQVQNMNRKYVKPNREFSMFQYVRNCPAMHLFYLNMVSIDFVLPNNLSSISVTRTIYINECSLITIDIDFHTYHSFSQLK
jgi:hypothetical protein